MTDARHEQAVTLLTGLERFVRLVVEREIPLSQANPANLTPSEKSPLVIGTPKPYTGLYSANSYMANRPGYSAYRRSIDADKILSPSPTAKSPAAMKIEPPAPPVNGIAKMNGVDERAKQATSPPPPPQPAPRQSISQPQPTIPQQPPSRQSVHTPIAAPPTPTPTPTPTPSTPTATPMPGEEKPATTATDSQEDIQVPKPITNEEFQAMIPAHFLRPQSTSSPSPDSSQKGPTVTVTIKQPDVLHGVVNFPPAPTSIGKVTETITKSTLTETVVTRVTDNQLVMPVIIEVRAAPLVP